MAKRRSKTFQRSQKNTRINKITVLRMRGGSDAAISRNDQGRFYSATVNLWNTAENSTPEQRNAAIVGKLGVENLDAAMNKVFEDFKTIKDENPNKSESEIISELLIKYTPDYNE